MPKSCWGKYWTELVEVFSCRLCLSFAASFLSRLFKKKETNWIWERHICFCLWSAVTESPWNHNIKHLGPVPVPLGCAMSLCECVAVCVCVLHRKSCKETEPQVVGFVGQNSRKRRAGGEREKGRSTWTLNCNLWDPSEKKVCFQRRGRDRFTPSPNSSVRPEIRLHSCHRCVFSPQWSSLLLILTLLFALKTAPWHETRLRSGHLWG